MPLTDMLAGAVPAPYPLFLRGFTRASGGAYFDATGVLRTAAVNAPRYDNDPATGEPRGILIEPGATNYVANNAGVGRVHGTPGTWPTGWSGTQNGLSRSISWSGVEAGIDYVDIRYFGTPSASWASIGFGTSTGVWSGQTVTAGSAYVRRLTGSLTNIGSVTLVNRANLSPSGSVDAKTNITANLDHWARGLATARHVCVHASPAGTLTGDGSTFLLLNGLTDPVDVTFRIGGAQHERGATPTSLIRTDGATAARASDVFTLPTGAFGWRAEGTIVVDCICPPTGGSQMLFEVSDETYSNRIYIYRSAAGAAVANIVAGGVVQASMSLGAWTPGARYRVALAFAANNFAVAVNGGGTVSDSSGSVPVVDHVALGSRWGVGDYWGGRIMGWAYVPRRLSDTELLAVTA